MSASGRSTLVAHSDLLAIVFNQCIANQVKIRLLEFICFTDKEKPKSDPKHLLHLRLTILFNDKTHIYK